VFQISAESRGASNDDGPSTVVVDGEEASPKLRMPTGQTDLRQGENQRGRFRRCLAVRHSSFHRAVHLFPKVLTDDQYIPTRFRQDATLRTDFYRFLVDEPAMVR
jgi:hypothetical protein